MSHWTRDDPQSYSIDTLPWRSRSDAELFSSVRVRTLSEDLTSGAGTFMIDIPPGWSHTEHPDEVTLEMFVLDGDLTASGHAVGAGGFVAVPKGGHPTEMTSRGGARAYAFRSSEWQHHQYYDDAVQVSKVWQLDWVDTEMPGYPYGIMHKSLRWPDPNDVAYHGGPNGLLRFALLAPGYEGVPERHNCWEEIIVLGGDLLMLGRGIHGPGSYLNNPAWHEHGPFVTARGSLLLVHSEQPITAVLSDPVDGAKLAPARIRTEYHQRASWLDPPSHSEWLLDPDTDR